MTGALIRPLAFALAVSATAGFAHAEGDPNGGRNTVTLKVSARGLDLKSEAGADAMLGRLARAASAACGGLPGQGPLLLAQTAAYRSCALSSVEAAVKSSRSPLLSRRYAALKGDRVLALAER